MGLKDLYQTIVNWASTNFSLLPAHTKRELLYRLLNCSSVISSSFTSSLSKSIYSVATTSIIDTSVISVRTSAQVLSPPRAISRPRPRWAFAVAFGLSRILVLLQSRGQRVLNRVAACGWQTLCPQLQATGNTKDTRKMQNKDTRATNATKTDAHEPFGHLQQSCGWVRVRTFLA